MPDIINVSVENKIATQTDDTEYVCSNSAYVVKFAFDSEWDAYDTKTARFSYNGGYIDIVFTGTECHVPIISDTYFFNIGVYAGNLHTTTPARVPCKKSILCGNEPEYSASQEVKNEFLSVLDKRTGDLADLTTEAKDTLVAAINEVARTGGGAGSMDLRVADGYIQYSKDGGSTWTNLISVAELKGAKGDPGAPGKDGVNGKPGAAGADGVTPRIGDNGNWYIGAEDTGKPSRGATGAPGKDGAGMDITGAKAGQIAKITAVDASGVPTAWSPVDMPTGGGGGSAGDAAPEILADVTTDEDASAVTLDGFSAYKVSLLIIMTAAESNKNITVMLNRDLWASKGWNGNAVIPTVANVANYLFAYDSICNGVIKITTRKSNWGLELENPKQAINTTGVTGTLWNGAAIQKLTVMIDYGNTMIPVGTRFIVWKG